jgi:hypothetical protein
VAKWRTTLEQLDNLIERVKVVVGKLQAAGCSVDDISWWLDAFKDARLSRGVLSLKMGEVDATLTANEENCKLQTRGRLQTLLDDDPSFHVAKMFRRLILTDDLVDFGKIRAKANDVNPAGLELETLLGALQRKAKTEEQGAEVDKLIARYEFESDLERQRGRAGENDRNYFSRSRKAGTHV